MDAPERVFLDSDSQFYRVAGRRLKDSNIEYIRADLVCNIIETEPEYPGEIPADIFNALRNAIDTNNMDFLIYALRSTVRVTKQSILERLEVSDGK